LRSVELLADLIQLAINAGLNIELMLGFMQFDFGLNQSFNLSDQLPILFPTTL